MKLVVTAQLYSQVLIDEVIELKYYPFIISFHPNENKILEEISIERGITDFIGLIPKVKVENHTVKQIEFPKEDFLAEQRELLQHLESFGSLDLDIIEIKWDNPKITWIPENEEERSMLPISSYKRNLEYDTSKKLTLGWLQGTVYNRRMLSHLVLPLSFHRKGINFYHRFEYSESFLSFYIMLEGVFGNGKTKNYQVEQEFLKSEIMNYAITETLKWLNNEENNNHKEWLLKFLKSKDWQYDIKGIISMLVKQRGYLSHFSLNSNRKQRDTFNEKENHSPAFIIMSICRFATIKLRLDPFIKK